MGLVKGQIGTICEKACSMLSDACLPKEFWGEAVNTAVYFTNRSPTKAVQGKTPYEIWYGKKIKFVTPKNFWL